MQLIADCQFAWKAEMTCQLGHENLLTAHVQHFTVTAVVLNLFHCWDPLNATDVVWDPQIKIEKVCALE